jgi:hypothetical protein
MDHHSILLRASDHHSSLLQDAAHGHLVARATAASPAGSRPGPGHRLGAALLQLGSRLRGITPAPVEPAPLPDTAASTSNSQ